MGMGGTKLEAYLLKGNNNATTVYHEIISSNITGNLIILITKGVDDIPSTFLESVSNPFTATNITARASGLAALLQVIVMQFHCIALPACFPILYGRGAT
jgi:hypothetical protein